MKIATGRARGLAVLAALACVAGLVAAGTDRSTPAALTAPTGGVVVQAPKAPVTGLAQDADAPGAVVPAAATTSRGYTFLQSTLVGQTPSGFGVWVDPAARHRWAIASVAAAAVANLRSYGTNIRWRGYGLPRSTEGVVRIREGSKGCGGDGGDTIGVTWAYWKTLNSGKRYVYRADIYLCPRLFRMPTWATKATVRHELGHAMGLGHTNVRYDGSYQIMNAVVRSSVVRYRAGDRRGFRTLAANTRVIKTEIPPIGKLDSSTWQNGQIQFTGWALLHYYRSSAVTITLTDNGKVIYQGGTPVLRSDVNAAHDAGSRTHGFQFSTPWPGGTHTYCVSARSVAHPVASARLGCVTWRS